MTASLPSTFKNRPESPTWNPTAKLPLDLCAKPLENGQAILANACPYSLARCSRSWTADALTGRNDRSAVSYTFARKCATLHDPIYSSVAEIHIPVMRRIRPTPLMLRMSTYDTLPPTSRTVLQFPHVNMPAVRHLLVCSLAVAFIAIYPCLPTISPNARLNPPHSSRLRSKLTSVYASDSYHR